MSVNAILYNPFNTCLPKHGKLGLVLNRTKLPYDGTVSYFFYIYALVSFIRVKCPATSGSNCLTVKAVAPDVTYPGL